MAKKTILNSVHRAMNARMVPFGGWDMPVNYGSQIAEHHAVRQNAGLFDVSHMTIIEVIGADAKDYLRQLLANDVAKVKEAGKAIYSCMLNEKGGVIDDLITYCFADDHFRVIVNAATTEKDLAWLLAHIAEQEVDIHTRDDLALIAAQGPKAREIIAPLLPDGFAEKALALKPFSAVQCDEWCVARTGYTGEDGFEIMLPDGAAEDFWNSAIDAGFQACGLGARDTLRLEAGMNLYGQDMDESITPLAAGLNWTVAWEPQERDFIGRAALTEQKNAAELPQFVGVLLEGKGVLRSHLKLFAGEQEVGEITSGGFSPTLERSIGLARVQAGIEGPIEVAIRNKRLPVRLTKPVFVRNGQPKIEL